MHDWDDAEQRVERAQELFDQRRWREALEELRAATDINPYNAGWHVNTGLALDELGRYAEAIGAYRRALEIEPNDLPAMARLGNDLRRIGDPDEAVRTFERIEAADPSFEPSYCHRILAYADLGDHERAEEMFYLARLFKDRCPDCYHHLGVSLAARGLLEKAVWCWRQALDLDDEYPQLDLRIAGALWRKGELQSARQHYLAALRKAPGDTDTLLELGELLVEMGRVDEAGEKFRRAVEQAPERPAGHFHHGQWLLRHAANGGATGAAAELAVEAFRRTLALDPTFAGAHLRLAEVHHRRGERTLARKHLRAEMLLRPQDPRVLIDLANLLMDTGLTRSAVGCLKRLVALEPDRADGWQNLAVAQFLTDRYEDGIDSCRRCLAVDPKNVMAVYNLALAHERLGQYEPATYWVTEGLRLAPRDPSLQRLELRVRLLRWKDWVARALRAMLMPATRARLGSGGSGGPLRGVGHLWRFRGR
jgi:tetratricopeptide (TPR) repeat protein